MEPAYPVRERVHTKVPLWRSLWRWGLLKSHDCCNSGFILLIKDKYNWWQGLSMLECSRKSTSNYCVVRVFFVILTFNFWGRVLSLLSRQSRNKAEFPGVWEFYLCFQRGNACELMSQYKKELVLFKNINLDCVELVSASKLINSRANNFIFVPAYLLQYLSVLK